VFEIYECLFELKEGDRSVSEFYGELKSLIDELAMHQSSITDVVTLSRVNSHSSSAFELVHSGVWVLVVCHPLWVLDIFYSLLMTSLT